jgi:hypothetical protein
VIGDKLLPQAVIEILDRNRAAVSKSEDNVIISEQRGFSISCFCVSSKEKGYAIYVQKILNH